MVEIVDAILADEIKAMYIMGENPAMSDPDQRPTPAPPWPSWSIWWSRTSS